MALLADLTKKEICFPYSGKKSEKEVRFIREKRYICNCETKNAAIKPHNIHPFITDKDYEKVCLRPLWLRL